MAALEDDVPLVNEEWRLDGGRCAETPVARCCACPGEGRGTARGTPAMRRVAVRLMERLGVLLAGARGLGHDAVRGGKNCKGSGQSLTNCTRAQLKWNQPAGFSLA